jgi:hypothetical protein
VSPLRVAIHSDLREHGEQAAVYRETLDLFCYAEELGFDTAWVRSYKFRRRGGAPGFSFPGGLPSPLVFLGTLAAVLDGGSVNGTDQELNPPAPGLSGRIWESALTEQTGRDSALRGNGVLIGTTQTVPAEVTAAAYHECLSGGAAPRVGLVVHVHPAADRRTALAALAADVETVYAWGREWLPHASTLEEKAAVINVHYGTPEQIAESIRAFPAFPYTTELQFCVAYGTTSHAQRRAAVEAVAAEIAPALGWKPAAQAATARG